jgi:hypothetical protein
MQRRIFGFMVYVFICDDTSSVVILDEIAGEILLRYRLVRC